MIDPQYNTTTRASMAPLSINRSIPTTISACHCRTVLAYSFKAMRICWPNAANDHSSSTLLARCQCWGEHGSRGGDTHFTQSRWTKDIRNFCTLFTFLGGTVHTCQGQPSWHIISLWPHLSIVHFYFVTSITEHNTFNSCLCVLNCINNASLPPVTSPMHSIFTFVPVASSGSFPAQLQTLNTSLISQMCLDGILVRAVWSGGATWVKATNTKMMDERPRSQRRRGLGRTSVAGEDLLEAL